jgi:hypothetical protein
MFVVRTPAAVRLSSHQSAGLPSTLLCSQISLLVDDVARSISVGAFCECVVALDELVTRVALIVRRFSLQESVVLVKLGILIKRARGFVAHAFVAGAVGETVAANSPLDRGQEQPSDCRQQQASNHGQEQADQDSQEHAACEG